MKKAKRIVGFVSILILASLLVSCSCGDDGGKEEEVTYTPTLTSITPSAGYNTEDTPVTITGEHLSAPGSVVLKNGTTYPGPYDLTGISLPDDTKILATVPAGLPADVYDVAVTIDSTELTLTNAFTVMTGVITPTVSLESIIPPLGYNGQDTPVMITGDGLREPSSIVLRNGVENPGPFDLTGISLGSTTNILATVPAGLPPDVYDVVVVIDSVEYVLTAAFTVTDVPPPFVEYVRPPSGWNQRDTKITIKGRYFQATPIVSLISSTGGLIELENVVFFSSASLSAVVPAGLTPGIYGIRVTNLQDGQYGELADAFEVSTIPPPRIDSITPTLLVAGAGGPLTIYGEWFAETGIRIFAVPDQAIIERIQEYCTDPTVTTDCYCTDPTNTTDCINGLELDSVIASGCTAGLCETLAGQVSAQVMGVYVVVVLNPDGQYSTFSSLLMGSAAEGKLGDVAGNKFLDSAHDLLLARQRHDSVVGRDEAGNAFIYTIGGDDGTEVYSAVEYFISDIFGELSESHFARPLNTARTALAAVSVQEPGGRVYVYAIGGSDSTAFGDADILGTVERARVLSQSSAPTDLTASEFGSGTLEPGIWTYRVSAVLEYEGEALPTSLKSVRLSAAGGVDLSWTAPVGETVLEYRIYRNDAADEGVNREHLIDTVDDAFTTYHDSGAPSIVAYFPEVVNGTTSSGDGGILDDGTWYYAVTMVTVNGEVTCTTDAVVVTSGGTNNNTVTLTWNPQEDALYYNVYRSPDVDDISGDRVLIAEKIIATTYVDDGSSPPIVLAGPENLTGETQYFINAALGVGNWIYQVSAMTERGESLPSDQLMVNITGTSNAVTITWDEVPEAIYYRIYRSDTTTSPDVIHMVKDNVTATVFTDRGLEAGIVLPADGYLQPPPGYRNYLTPGTLGKWQVLAGGLVTGRYGHGAAVVTTLEGITYIYVNGGGSYSDTTLTSTEVTAVLEGGNLEGWRETISMTNARAYHGFTKAAKRQNDILNLPYATYFYSVNGMQVSEVIVDSVEVSALIGPPENVTLASVTGGTLTGTYYYRISAVVPDIGGGPNTVESQASMEQDITIDGVTETAVEITWDKLSEATGYRIYRSSTTGTQTLLVEVGDQDFYIDDGSIGPGTTYPAEDGELIAWVFFANSGPGRFGNRSLTGNGFLYVLQGKDSVIRTKIDGDKLLFYGDIEDKWTVPSNLSSIEARAFHSHVHVNSFVYILGGLSTGDIIISSVEQVPF